MTCAADFGAWFGPCGAHVGNLGASWGALRYDGKRASSVAWSCKSGREALGEGVWGRGEAPRLGEVTGAADFGPWFGPCGAYVGNLGASWGALGHFGGVVERIWVSLAPFGRFGVGFFVYLRWNFHLFFVIFRLFVDIFCISSDRDNSSKTSTKPRKNNGFSTILSSGRFQRCRTKQ